MILEELQARYGLYVAERIHQSLSLEVFAELEIEELVPHFDLIAEKSYEEYRRRLDSDLPDDAPVNTKEAYLNVLRRRWQDAEELVHFVLQAEEEAMEEGLGLRA